MDEADFWARLEFRICREFSGMKDRELRSFWCDGLIPQRYYLDDARPRITGTAWICQGEEQAEWKFVLVIPQPSASQDEIDWASLLPGENLTKWMAIDRETRCIEIEPQVGVHDMA